MEADLSVLNGHAVTIEFSSISHDDNRMTYNQEWQFKAHFGSKSPIMALVKK